MKKNLFFYFLTFLLFNLLTIPTILAAQQKMQRIGIDTVSVDAVEVNDVEVGDEELIGGDQDEHGCYLMAGYRWCESKQKCLRTWEEDCPGMNTIQASVQAKVNNAEQLRQQIQLYREELKEESKNWENISIIFNEFMRKGVFLPLPKAIAYLNEMNLILSDIIQIQETIIEGY